MDVSKNRGTPKWKVYNEKLIKIDDLGVPLFLETPIWFPLFYLLSMDFGPQELFAYTNLL